MDNITLPFEALFSMHTACTSSNIPLRTLKTSLLLSATVNARRDAIAVVVSFSFFADAFKESISVVWRAHNR